MNGIVVDGKHWKLKIPVGGDMKLLSAMMGLCGCSSEWSCMFCKAPTGEFFKHKEEWLEGHPLRNLEEHLQMQHIPSCVSVGVRQRVEQREEPARRSRGGGRKSAAKGHMGKTKSWRSTRHPRGQPSS